MSWSFIELKRRLETKLSYLCIVPVKKKTVMGNDYFKYCDATFYELKNFECFLDLIKKGKIKVTFKLSYYHTGEKYGQLYDKGTTFDMNFDYVNELFSIVDV